MDGVIGIDEVGRGAWAGPLVVGAVLLQTDIPGLKDSKLLTKKQRAELDKLIRVEAECVGLGWVSPGEVDDLGLTEATTLACKRALEGIDTTGLTIVIDGKINYLSGDNNLQAECLVKADSLVPAVSAASIVAKVARDEYMEQMALEYPEYGFEKHVGYGTQMHQQAVDDHGLTPLHRWTYKNFRNKYFVEYET